MFNSITEVVCNQLEDIIGSQGGVDDDTTVGGYITAKDFMNDFATEEFLTKNIRVRPQSGATGKDIDEKQSDHISKGNLLGVLGEPTEDEEKYNKMVNLEMDDQRKKIKLKREEVAKKKQMEADKLAS